MHNVDLLYCISFLGTRFPDLSSPAIRYDIIVYENEFKKRTFQRCSAIYGETEKKQNSITPWTIEPWKEKCAFTVSMSNEIPF